MHRFYIDRPHDDTAILVDPVQLHHIRDVLRLKTGDKAVICDKEGREYTGVIMKMDKKQAEFKLSPLHKKPASNVALTIACAIPKGSRMDDIIDSLTQLGVARIVPLQTERVVVRLDAARAKARQERWLKIAQSAAQQCGRSNITAISPVTDIADAISNSSGFDLKLIPHLSGERKLIKDIIAEKQPKSIIVLIGPEGDFTPAEVTMALSNGFIPVSLGDTVLRVATAAIAAAAYIKLEMDK
jgi:16S rRNA (uracil1498-N3)-methyltransferase